MIHGPRRGLFALAILAAALPVACRNRLAFEVGDPPTQIRIVARGLQAEVSFEEVPGARGYVVYTGTNNAVSPRHHVAKFEGAESPILIDLLNAESFTTLVITAQFASGESAPTPNLSAYAEPPPFTLRAVWSTDAGDLFEGATGTEFGSALAAGDLNDDGYPDLAVGAPGFGRVFLFEGGPSGLSGTGVALEPLDVIGSRFGAALAIGSLPDYLPSGPVLAVGAPGEGKVYLYQFPLEVPLPIGIGPMVEIDEPGPHEPGSGFGSAIAIVNTALSGDGGDLLIGAPGKDCLHGVDCGALYWGPSYLLAPETLFTGTKGSSFGAAIAGLGQLHGDAFEEVAVGAPGRDGGEVRLLVRQEDHLIVQRTLEGTAGRVIGRSIAGAGGLNGHQDALDDFALAAEGDTTVELDLFLATNDASMVEPFGEPYTDVIDDPGLAGPAIVVARGGKARPEDLGSILVGLPHSKAGSEGTAGGVFLFSATLDGMDAVPEWSRVGGEGGAEFGAALLAADFNADGLDDVVVGSPGGSLVELFVTWPPAGPEVFAGGRLHGRVGSAIRPVHAGFIDDGIGNPYRRYQCLWAWGDAAESRTVILNGDCTPENAGQVSFQYSTPGRYVVSLQVTSQDKRVGMATTAVDIE